MIANQKKEKIWTSKKFFYINFQLKCLGMEFTAYKDELMAEEALTSFTICNAH